MLRILDDVLVLVRDVATFATASSRHDACLAKQLRSALSSAALDIAEGSSQRGARLSNHCCIALRSARESFTALRVAEAWGYIAPLPLPIADRFDKVFATLTKLTKLTR